MITNRAIIRIKVARASGGTISRPIVVTMILLLFVTWCLYAQEMDLDRHIVIYFNQNASLGDSESNTRLRSIREKTIDSATDSARIIEHSFASRREFLESIVPSHTEGIAFLLGPSFIPNHNLELSSRNWMERYGIMPATLLVTGELRYIVAVASNSSVDLIRRGLTMPEIETLIINGTIIIDGKQYNYVAPRSTHAPHLHFLNNYVSRPDIAENARFRGRETVSAGGFTAAIAAGEDRLVGLNFIFDSEDVEQLSNHGIAIVPVLTIVDIDNIIWTSRHFPLGQSGQPNINYPMVDLAAFLGQGDLGVLSNTLGYTSTSTPGQKTP